MIGPSRLRERCRGQRGAITPALLIGAVLLAVVAIGATTIGRLAAVRADTQRAADAAVLAAAAVIRERGLPFDGSAQQAAASLARRNTGLDLGVRWTVRETDDHVEIAAAATVRVAMPLLVFRGGAAEVTAQASSRLAQRRFDDAERRLAKLAIVLDYSGSMKQPFSGGRRRAIDVLEESVTVLLEADLAVDLGAVFYSDRVFRTVPVSDVSRRQIAHVMDSYDAGGVTNTAAALTQARTVLLSSADTGRYVLLISDGEPCCRDDSFSAARAAAVRLWAADATIFTLEIRRQNSSPELSQFMTDVAGAPLRHGDPEHHFVATTADALVDHLEDIVAAIVCTVGPIEPAPADPADLRVFLASGGHERRLPVSADLGADQDLEAFQYDSAERSIRLTARACDAVTELGAEVVVRQAPPALAQ